jgi:fatty-acyl-CoA synthase
MTDGRRDGEPLRKWIGALERSAAAARRPDATLATLVAERAALAPDAPALLSHDARMTYGTLAAQANRAARWALARGLRSGDVVCLLMENCPDYVAIWLGITRVGGVVALLNTNLAGEALAHCMRAAAPRHVIAGASLAGRVRTIAGDLGPEVTCWLNGADDPDFSRLDTSIERLDSGELDAAEMRPPAMRDIALLIYTSGTTGLPKAARISHARLVEWSQWFAGMMQVNPDDRMYNCLPMYHSVGGVVAVGALLVSGGAVAIRRHFSARSFWDDIAAFDCTLFQYIGELCRYLVNAPPHRLERAHRLRLCCGNGLRGDVWERFQARFAIPDILEFYAATEGNVTLYNCEGRPGAIGRVPGFLAHRVGIALIRTDPDTNEPHRDARGYCIACATDEPGEAIGRIRGGNFEGYTDAAATERKILRDVFEAGDAWFRTGDLMRKDAGGFYFFVDRLGDTFRWKGENVSTAEVAGIIAACPGVIDAVVFGVIVPGADGRAGMAAIAADASLQLDVLHRHVAANLPDYARPRFLRLCGEIARTGTFKLSKAALAREGYEENDADDPLYVEDDARDTYVPIDAAMRARIAAGMRL